MSARRYLTPNELRDMLERQGGLCAREGCTSEGPFEADHAIVHAWEPNAKPSQLLCIPCHRSKTKLDVKAIAKSKRLNGTTSSQWSRRQERGSKLKGAGFRGWRKMNGTVVVK